MHKRIDICICVLCIFIHSVVHTFIPATVRAATTVCEARRDNLDIQVYICICVDIFKYTYIYLYIHACEERHDNLDIQVYIFVCVYIFKYTYIYIYIYSHQCIYLLLQGRFGNPSSGHWYGVKEKEAVHTARAHVAGNVYIHV